MCIVTKCNIELQYLPTVDYIGAGARAGMAFDCKLYNFLVNISKLFRRKLPSDENLVPVDLHF